jgi:hypothetical protein
MQRAVVVASIVMSVVIPLLPAQHPSWRELPGPSAAAHIQAAVTTDVHRGRLVALHGNDTWEGDGGAWWRVANGPAGGRRDAALAYDRHSRTTIAFGGAIALFLTSADTFAWDGQAWQLLTPVQSPPPRLGAGATYDVARRRIVLFGGQTSSGSYLSDTWEYDGTTWLQRTPASSPIPRGFARLTYDTARGRTLLFGGSQGSTYLGDCWTWDGTAWAPAPAPATGGLDRPVFAFDERRARAVLFGRDFGLPGWVLRTWEYDGTQWAAFGGGPAIDTKQAGMFDPVRGTVVVAAAALDPLGATQTGSTWHWDGATWRDAWPFDRPGLAVGAAAAHVPATHSILVHGGGQWTGTAVLDTVHECRGGEWRAVRSGGPSPRRDGAAATEASGDGLWFGGVSATALLADTWRYGVAGWTQLTPAIRPSPRYGHRMVLDTVRGRVVLFGGTHQGGVLDNETWEWDGGNWAQRTPAIAPPARQRGAMAFDGGRGVVVLFGGALPNGTTLADQWHWDGTNWTQHTGTVPPARHGAHMAYDAAMDRVVLTGGWLGASGAPVADDTWLWDGAAWTASPTTFHPLSLSSYSPRGGMTFDPELRSVLLWTAPNGNSAIDTRTYTLTAATLAAPAPYGVGCGAGNGFPTASAIGWPRVGNGQFGYWTTGCLPQGFAFVCLGFAPDAVALPGGCTALVRDPVALLVVADAAGTAHVALPLPAVPGLQGLALHAQPVAFDPAGPLGGLASLGAGLVVTVD